MSFLNNKSILVTGATGTFGKAFIKIVLAQYRPKKLIIFSRDEMKQFDLAQKYPIKNFPNLRFFIGDVRDYERLNMAFKDVDIVIHAAAMKQVPISEYNPFECIKTNISGAENVIKASLANNVEKVIALSTDKAVNPINLYGATKLASEKLFVASNNISGNSRTRFAVVRYGNVIGSRGSVIPFFVNLLKEKSAYLPITDPLMTRFFIPIEEGVNFVLISLRRMFGGEIFIPKMPSVKIKDIASSIAPDLKQKIIGIRPGEKLHEVLCSHESSHLTLEFNDHFVIRPSIIFSEKSNNFSINNIKEKSKNVKSEFSYSSDNNPIFLSKKEISKMCEKFISA